MVSPSNPSPSDEAPTPTDQWLDTGLTALDEGDYLTALSYLAAVHQAHPHEPVGLQAQMGLVVAYERFGQPEQAIALCQELNHNSDTRVQSWAASTLEGLAQRHPRLLSAPSSIPVPPPAKPTGFVPLEGEAPPAVTAPPTNPAQSPTLPLIPPISGQEQPLSAVKLPDLQTPPPTQKSGPPPRATPRPARSGSGADATLIQGPTTQIPPLQAKPHTWRQAGRVQRWQPLSKVTLVPFWLLQIGTAIALFLVLRAVIWSGLAIINQLLIRLSFLGIGPMGAAYQDHSFVILLGLGLLLGISPWLLSGILRVQAGLRSLPMAKLAACSPEASRLINRLCRQRKIPLPTLGLLPTQAPLLLTYGWLPRNSHIVVSQGLLDRLSEDEIAVVYAAELGHILQRDAILASLLVGVLQIPYLIYGQTATWGDTIWQHRRSAKGNNPFAFWGLTVVMGLLVAVSALSYGVYWLLRWPAIWFSQLRLYYSDRLAIEATGNPNGLTRALLKITVGIAEDIQRQGQTSSLLESFDLLAPVGYRQALCLGSTSAYTSFESLLAWDRLNPFRYWLAINQPHPLMGDRLDKLGLYARQWRLETELNWGANTSPTRNRQSWPERLNTWMPLLLQGAPFFGVLFGLGLGLVLWLLGGVAILTDLWMISWLFGDRWILISCLPIGFSIGTFLRINPFFREISRFNSQTTTKAEDYLNRLHDSKALPVESQPIYLQGKLLGRRGIANWLGQDLILQTQIGLIQLHHTHQLGPIGTLLSQGPRPGDLIRQSVLATGWFRQGATPWIDLEVLRSQGGKMSYSGHPIWSTVLACSAAALGAYWIFSFAGLPPS